MNDTEEVLDKLRRMIKDVNDRLGRIESQVSALVRHDLMRQPTSVVEDLYRRRFASLSQHEEDGMLYALFEHIGAPLRYFVDIGCGGNGGNSGFLARDCGWSGVMIDAVERNVQKSSELVDKARVNCVTAMVSSRNVSALLGQSDVPPEPDLVSLDIDSTDYWVLAAMMEHYRPRAIVAEYNSLFGPTAAVTIPDIENFVRGDEGVAHWYYGASLAAFTKLCDRGGYRLALTDLTGTNAVFIRRDLGLDIPAANPQAAFRYYRHWVRAEKIGDVVAHFRASGLALVDV